MEETEEKAGKPVWLRIFAIVAGLVVTVFFTASARSEPPASMAEAIGAGVGTALLPWIAVHFAALRRSAVAWTIIAFTLFAGVAAFGHVGHMNRAISKDMEGISDDLDRALTAGEAVKSDAIKGKGGAFSAINAELMRGLIASRDAYDMELSKAGFADLFVASKAAQSATLDDCTRIANLRESVRHYRVQWEAQFDLAEQRAEKSAASEAGKTGFLKGFRQARSNGAQGQAQMWLEEEELIELGVRLCNTLARRRWKAQGDDFLFYDNNDLTEFTKITARFRTVAARQQNRQQTAEKQLRQRLSELKQP